MPRIAYVILCSCLLAFSGLLAGSAHAGDYGDGYYRDGYYGGGGHYHPHRAGRAWYSSNCCYRKIVRHVRVVRYVRVHRHRYHRYGYYERPRYRVSHYRVAPRFADYERSCHRGRVRVIGANGGWVWAVRARCQ